MRDPTFPSDESAIVLDGRFRVTTKGEVFKITSEGEEPACVAIVGRERNYAMISYGENGKQKRAYVHRLVATAFIPNPDNRSRVLHLDGNPMNNAASNLQWCTPSQITGHAYENGWIDTMKRSVPCAVCGGITLSKTGLCTKCRRSVASEQRREQREIEAARGLEGIDVTLLTQKERECVLLRLDGLTTAEIARSCGVSRQQVHQVLVAAMRKGPPSVARARPLTQKEQRQIKERLDKKLDKARRLEAEYLMLYEEVQQEVQRINEQFPDCEIMRDIAL